MSEPLAIDLNRDQHRYEARLGDAVAVLQYKDAADGIRVIVHTEVPEAFAGHGVGGRLARRALDDARAAGLKIVPQCPFVRAYVERHPEYGDLIAR